MISKFLSNKLNIKNSFLLVFCLIVIICLAINPAKYSSVCLNGILIFGKNLLPAMLPFIFFTKLLTSTGYIENFSKTLSPITKKLYNSPAISSYVFLMSILSGYPMGAKITADLYAEGFISRDEAHRICSFTSNSGPMFIIGTVGSGMLLNVSAGYIILISHIVSALLNGLIYKKYQPKKINFELDKTLISHKNSDKKLSNCMENSILSILLVGGYVAVFFVITEVLASLKLFSPIISLLNTLGVEENLSKGVINGIFEITNGCKSISMANTSLKVKTILSSFVVSFGGLAVAFQGFAFLGDFHISKRFFFFQKFTQAIISTAITILLCFIISL